MKKQRLGKRIVREGNTAAPRIIYRRGEEYLTNPIDGTRGYIPLNKLSNGVYEVQA